MLSEQHRNNTTTTSDNAVQFEATIKNSNAKFDKMFVHTLDIETNELIEFIEKC